MRNLVIEEDLKDITDAGLPWQDLEGKNVLITGANGFLPAYMVETLLYLNDRKLNKPVNVLGLVRNRAKALKRFSHYEGRKDFELLVQDAAAPVIADRKIDYIVHAASQASPKYFGTDPVGTLLPNVLGTYHLLELARKNAVEGFLFFSSGEVYGEVDERKVPTKEDDYGYLDPTNIRSCYAESKRIGETMCVSWHHQYAVPAKIVRPFHTYGPGMDLQDGRVFADFIADILHTRNIVLKSDGSAIRAFCYLSDAVTGFFTALLKGKNAEAYNVGNDKGEISILGLANLLVELFPSKKLKVIRDEKVGSDGYLKSKITRNCPDISKMRTLGWEPKYSLREGFERTVRSFSA
jgi:nucleoside-diphosphate-sugar epimerase